MINSALRWLIVVGLIAFSACQSRWEEEEKEGFSRQCLASARIQNLPQPEQYCNCVLERLQREFPNPTDMEDGLKLGDIAAYGQTCLDSLASAKVVWPDTTIATFTQGCLAVAREQGQPQPERYCQCIMGAVMVRYPYAEQLSQLNADSMQAMGRACAQRLAEEKTQDGPQP
jgi:hypothetical protein